MTPTKYNLTHYEQLRQMEKQISEQIFSRTKKMTLSYVTEYEVDNFETEVAELEEIFFNIQMTITSFSKIFQIT